MGSSINIMHISSSEPEEPEECFTHMDAWLYKAAAEGNSEVFTNNQGLQNESLKTPNHDNVLHLNLATEEISKFSIIKIFSNKFSASVRHCYSKRMLKDKLLCTLQQGMDILLL
ncbi:hypothetical protein Gotur_020929 [Gossypium turneri]